MNDIEKLKQLIEQAEELIKVRTTFSKPEFIAWHTRTERYLTAKYGQDSIELKNFKNRAFGPIVFASRVKHDDSIDCVKDLKTTVLELKDYLEEEEESGVDVTPIHGNSIISPDKVFIIHGHNGELKEAVARLIESQGINAIILSERANQGKTIIEKFEDNSDVGAAIALFTNDDMGRSKNSEEDAPRARQNVVFEAGYFMGKLGRDRIVLIAEEGIELSPDQFDAIAGGGCLDCDKECGH